jgi:hypothetical protein
MAVSTFWAVQIPVTLKLSGSLRTVRHTARAQIQSTVLFDSDMSKLRPEDILDALSDDVDRFRLVEQDTLTKPLSRIVLELGMAKSKGE